MLGRVLAPVLLGVGASCVATGGWACDAVRGRQMFETKCMTCHTAVANAPHTVGPNLHGVVGRAVATAPGFNYSDALKALGNSWTPERLLQFLENPQARAPGTYMAFTGVRRPEDRQALVCWLESL